MTGKQTKERGLLNARFRYKASVEDLYYHANRNIDRNQMMRLAECNFINRNENLLITGSTGIGKSYIASALGHQACMLGYRVLYANTPKLFAKLKMAKADASYIKEITKIERQHLLILYDFGIQPFDAQSRQSLMEIIEDRHGKTSMIITSQLPVNKWYQVISEKTIADAILDRIIHDAHRMELKGESLRKKRQAVEESSDDYKPVNLLFLTTAFKANYTTLRQQNRWSISQEINWSTSTKYPIYGRAWMIKTLKK
jgi:DNA replication protein DnaC